MGNGRFALMCYQTFIVFLLKADLKTLNKVKLIINNQNFFLDVIARKSLSYRAFPLLEYRCSFGLLVIVR